MNWKKTLTPKDTEEIKPGLFVQERNPGDYRVINPICWKDQYRWKKQFSWKNLITVIIIAFLAWSYMAETSYSRELQENPCDLLPKIQEFCSEKGKLLGDIYGEENYTVIIQDYP